MRRDNQLVMLASVDLAKLNSDIVIEQLKGSLDEFCRLFDVRHLCDETNIRRGRV